MSRICSFDNLPNEVLISIFEYLKAADNFYAFFNLNSRLRKLIKQYVWFSRLELRNDIDLFSELQCWYKNLDFIDDGQIFYLIPFNRKLQQINSNSNELHWHISKERTFSKVDPRVEKIIKKYSIRLNPLFHPLGQTFSSGFQNFLQRHYSLQFHELKQTIFDRTSDTNCFQFNPQITDEICIHLDFIFHNERQRLIDTIINAAFHIWRDLQNIEDFNILNINNIDQ